MSFHEKSAWASLVAILLVFVPFFVVVFSVPGYPIVIPAFIAAVVVLTVVLAVVHIFFALGSARIRRTGDVPPRDEREIAIELRSTKIAGFVLAFVVMTWCLAAYAGIPISRVRHHRAMAAADAVRLAEVQESAIADAATADPATPDAGNLSLSHLLPVPAHDALFFVHILFSGFVLANVVYYASLVFGYRRTA